MEAARGENTTAVARNSFGDDAEEVPPPLPEAFHDEAAFLAHVRATAVAPEQCVLDATPQNIRNHWQGSFKLIATDLALTLGESAADASVAALRAAGVAEAFALRRQLVNMKKACLRLFHDVERLVGELKRQDQYFFKDSPLGHTRVLSGERPEEG